MRVDWGRETAGRGVDEEGGGACWPPGSSSDLSLSTCSHRFIMDGRRSGGPFSCCSGSPPAGDARARTSRAVGEEEEEEGGGGGEATGAPLSAGLGAALGAGRRSAVSSWGASSPRTNAEELANAAVDGRGGAGRAWARHAGGKWRDVQQASPPRVACCKADTILAARGQCDCASTKSARRVAWVRVGGCHAR